MKGFGPPFGVIAMAFASTARNFVRASSPPNFASSSFGGSYGPCGSTECR